MKNVIVTGASKGIGYHTALEFARQGHRVLAIARNGELLNKLKAESDANGRVEVMPLDLAGDYDVNRLTSSFGSVDVLMNNAGALVNKAFGEINADDLQRVYNVNVFAPFKLIQKLMPYFNQGAHIINIGSVGGMNGTQKFPGLTAYSSSKAAMSCLAECLQAEFEDSGIIFNSLALGAVQTEMLSQAFPGYKAPVSSSEMAKYIVNFTFSAPPVIRGKTISVSRTNP